MSDALIGSPPDPEGISNPYSNNDDRTRKYISLDGEVKTGEEIDREAEKKAEKLRERAKGGEEVYIRFGAPPASERSYNSRDDVREDGVSVYRAWKVDGEYIIDASADCSAILHMRDREFYEVDGREVGTGSDGEPLLRDVTAEKVTNPDYSVILC